MIDTQRTFTTGSGTLGKFHSLPALRDAGIAPDLARLPVSIRIVLESLIRNFDGKKITENDIKNLANWNPVIPGDYEIPFVVARIVLQDFTGVPLLVDLAAMRSAVYAMGKNPAVIEPLVPVDLVVDHSVQVDFAGTRDAYEKNLDLEFHRNKERYEFLKWGEQAFDTFKVVPPGIGIVHQVNLEYLAKGVLEKDGVWYPDTLVGTDSHTTMINGLGVVGWGVGGIEAEAGMLGQPVTFLVPEVIGVCLTGHLQTGVTATDLVLRVTELLRQKGVVGKFVEFYGPGARALSIPDRATIANMAPEYGATMGFFGIDDTTVRFMEQTGRSADLCETFRNYYKAQELWGIADEGDIDFSDSLTLDLATVKPSISGPKRPQDRIELDELKSTWSSLMMKDPPAGFGKIADMVSETGSGVGLDVMESFGAQPYVDLPEPPTPIWDVTVDSKNGTPDTITHGSVLIAAITSCTNTSNPSVMIAAGLLARNANQRGLTVNPSVKTSLGPGSRVVTDYLEKTTLQKELDQLGFQTIGYGCTTCIGNSGPLDKGIEDVVKREDVIAASVLSGNRNFEARVHPSIKANFLMSPPLVVAFALAGTVDIDFNTEPLGLDQTGKEVYLREIWPSDVEVAEIVASSISSESFHKLYSGFSTQNPKWNAIEGASGEVYPWDQASTYIQEPPFFTNYTSQPRDITQITDAKALAIFGDSVTTDHISPAGSIKPDSPAGQYLTEHDIAINDYNSYGSRRGNDRVMTRGTFANVRIKNLLAPGTEGGVTLRNGHIESIYQASKAYEAEGRSLIIIGGADYGMGSSRDWAAKGTRLLGVKSVITKSFERIHRSNLAGMGVLPCTFVAESDYNRVLAAGSEAIFNLAGLSNHIKPMETISLHITPMEAPSFTVPVVVRLDTPVEIDYYRAGGILPYVLTQILRKTVC